MTTAVRWVLETRRGHKDHPWGPEIISRAYFDSEDGANSAMEVRQQYGHLLGRKYTVKREEFECPALCDDDDLDADTSTGDKRA